MMETVGPVLSAIGETVDLVGLLIVLFGAVKFLFVYSRIELKRLAGIDCVLQIQEARRSLGTYILVALEFMIVSDVIGSVVSRSRESLIELAVIVIIRTAMGFFLERELQGEGGTKGEATP